MGKSEMIFLIWALLNVGIMLFISFLNVNILVSFIV